MKELAKALLEAQKEMGNATKGATNPFFKSKYADLNAIREACMPHLNKHGIVVLQPIVNKDGKNFVETILLHESGQSISGFTEIVNAKPNDAQAQGSGITYARRYGLQSLVNVGAEDDDGNKASNPVPQQEQPKSKQRLMPGTEAFLKAKEALKAGTYTMEQIEKKYELTPTAKELLTK